MRPVGKGHFSLFICWNLVAPASGIAREGGKCPQLGDWILGLQASLALLAPGRGPRGPQWCLCPLHALMMELLCQEEVRFSTVTARRAVSRQVEGTLVPAQGAGGGPGPLSILEDFLDSTALPLPMTGGSGKGICSLSEHLEVTEEWAPEVAAVRTALFPLRPVGGQAQGRAGLA